MQTVSLLRHMPTEPIIVHASAPWSQDGYHKYICVPSTALQITTWTVDMGNKVREEFGDWGKHRYGVGLVTDELVLSLGNWWGYEAVAKTLEQSKPHIVVFFNSRHETRQNGKTTICEDEQREVRANGLTWVVALNPYISSPGRDAIQSVSEITGLHWVRGGGRHETSDTKWLTWMERGPSALKSGVSNEYGFKRDIAKAVLSRCTIVTCGICGRKKRREVCTAEDLEDKWYGSEYLSYPYGTVEGYRLKEWAVKDWVCSDKCSELQRERELWVEHEKKRIRKLRSLSAKARRSLQQQNQGALKSLKTEFGQLGTSRT